MFNWWLAWSQGALVGQCLRRIVVCPPPSEWFAPKQFALATALTGEATSQWNPSILFTCCPEKCLTTHRYHSIFQKILVGLCSCLHSATLVFFIYSSTWSVWILSWQVCIFVRSWAYMRIHMCTYEYANHIFLWFWFVHSYFCAIIDFCRDGSNSKKRTICCVLSQCRCDFLAV